MTFSPDRKKKEEEEEEKNSSLPLLFCTAYQGQDWKIMQVMNTQIRDDVTKKYGQYTKRVNGEMIKGK